MQLSDALGTKLETRNTNPCFNILPTGTEEVKVDVVASTTKVVLHNNDIEIHTASFINAEGIPVESSGISYDKKEETASIEFSAELPLGEGKLAISFKGNLNVLSIFVSY